MGRRVFTREFKLEAVKLVKERGVSVSQVAKDLDIGPSVVSRWVRESSVAKAHAFPGRGQMKPDDAEIARLKRELAKTKAERDILKKNHRVLCEGPDVKFAAIAEYRHLWPLSWMCEVFEVTRTGFYAWFKRPPSARERLDTEQTVLIRASFADSDQTYGARRVRRDLRDWGHRCGIHRVERLMSLARLEARPKRRRLPFDLGTRQESCIAPNVLDRRFDSEAPNNKWVADFTYLWTSEGWLYVAVVLDLFSRRVVGWSMSSQMTSQLVTDAMLMAIWRRGPVQALLSHSDQGSQYTSEQFQRLLAAHGVTCSMSRSGNCWDNAAMESFFSTLKIERTNRKFYATRDEARADVFDYIERFYNAKRRHSTLGYLSPIDYEKSASSG